jgi:limonene-1,2-epoxide hydrolase
MNAKTIVIAPELAAATHDQSLSAEQATERLRHFFETISLDTLAHVRALYAPTAWFKDPFNEVKGVAAIENIFRHMFEQVHTPHFVIHDIALHEDGAFLTWDFRFRRTGRHGEHEVIRGATHVRYDRVGRVTYHRDYWDAAEELYAKLPVLGGLMRFLRRRLAS